MALSRPTAETKPVADPEYITYLLDQEHPFDWYFTVGNGTKNTPVEKIGVVKKMLLAHSAVFRAELHESPLRERNNNTDIKDIFPNTFKNLLRYTYGYNNTASLSFDEADDLLYAADKYMMEPLKRCLAARLMQLLSCKNICSLLNNQACHRVLELDSMITHIIQFETKQVLASPQFLGMCPKAFITILKQEKLQVPEMEMWHSAVQWAKNRAKSNEGPALRDELTTLLPHIRVCTVSLDDFCREIMPTRVLTNSEMVEVGMYLGNHDHKPNLQEICDVTEPRTVTAKFPATTDLFTFNICNDLQSYWTCHTSFGISTREFYVELCSLELYKHNNSTLDCRLEIKEVPSVAQPSGSVLLMARVEAPAFTIDFPENDDGSGSVVLLPNSTYTE